MGMAQLNKDLLDGYHKYDEVYIQIFFVFSSFSRITDQGRY